MIETRTFLSEIKIFTSAHLFQIEKKHHVITYTILIKGWIVAIWLGIEARFTGWNLIIIIEYQITRKSFLKLMPVPYYDFLYLKN